MLLAKDLKSLEQYGAFLVKSLVEIETMWSFNIEAYNKGLLDEGEIQIANTINALLKKLYQLNHRQVENILERTKLSSNSVDEELKSLEKKGK